MKLIKKKMNPVPFKMKADVKFHNNRENNWRGYFHSNTQSAIHLLIFLFVIIHEIHFDKKNIFWK